jgi:hypothetical protein
MATRYKLIHDGNSIFTAWSSWTPSWTNFTAGSATITAYYKQVGKIVTARLSVNLAADSSVTGSIRFSLPVTAVSYPYDANEIETIGVGWTLDTGAANPHFVMPVKKISTTGAKFTYIDVNGVTQDTSSTTPMTWTTNDKFGVTIIYEAA